jgi:hypothetical protein
MKEGIIMASDFTVIIQTRQHFGDQADFFGGLGSFVGQDRTFVFDCPGVDRGQLAVLVFQTLSVDHDSNVLELNDKSVAGRLPVSRIAKDPDGE